MFETNLFELQITLVFLKSYLGATLVFKHKLKKVNKRFCDIPSKFPSFTSWKT